MNTHPPRPWHHTELATTLGIPAAKLHVKLADWTRRGYLTRTKPGTYILTTPP